MSKLYDESLLPSKKYLNKNFLPKPAEIKFRSIHRETPYKSYEHVLVLYIRSGEGTIYINSAEAPLRSGMCYVLHFFMFFKIIPAKGQTIEIAEIFISSATYHFMFTLPGAHFDSFETTGEFYVCSPSEIEKEKIEELIADISNCPFSEISCIYLYELFGRLFLPY